MAHDDEALMTSRQVRDDLGGVSQMWLHRRLTTDPTFPKPTYIAKRRYWTRGQLRAWKHSKVVGSAPKPVAPPREAATVAA
jgi:predicted DNA-binding transcriptional regulator AlpA